MLCSAARNAVVCPYVVKLSLDMRECVEVCSANKFAMSVCLECGTPITEEVVCWILFHMQGCNLQARMYGANPNSMQFSFACIVNFLVAVAAAVSFNVALQYDTNVAFLLLCCWLRCPQLVLH